MYLHFEPGIITPPNGGVFYSAFTAINKSLVEYLF